MGVWDVLTLSLIPLGRNLSTVCSEHGQAEVAWQHIVFVCIKICAIEWTIKCPFVIFIGLQCCKMLKAFIFSFAMSKAWSSIVHGHKMLTRIYFTFIFLLMLTAQCYDKVIIKKEIELFVGWLRLLMTRLGRPPKLHNYTVQPHSRNKHDIINPVHGLHQHSGPEISLACAAIFTFSSELGMTQLILQIVYHLKEEI